MDVMCLMGLYPKEYIGTIEKDVKSGNQTAANKLQWALVDGLEENGVNVSIINSLYIGSFPSRHKEINIPTFYFKHKDNSNNINVGFCNLTVFKWFSRYFGVKKEIDKWVKQNNDEKYLLIYALATPFANIAKYVKKKYENVKVCIVVPDLPEFMNVKAMKSNLGYRLLKNIEIKMIKNCIKNVDGYVFLTDSMKNWFN